MESEFLFVILNMNKNSKLAYEIVGEMWLRNPEWKESRNEKN